jgi:hypothetical protein
MNDPDPLVPPLRLRVMQIIVVALLLGVATITGIALYIVIVVTGGRGQAPPQDLPIITLVAGLMLATNVPLAFALPSMQLRSALRRMAARTRQADGGAGMGSGADVEELLAVRQVTLIVSLALLESVAFMAAIAYMMEAQEAALGIVGTIIVLMLAKFPTRDRLRMWLDRQLQRLNDLRQQA